RSALDGEGDAFGGDAARGGGRRTGGAGATLLRGGLPGASTHQRGREAGTGLQEDAARQPGRRRRERALRGGLVHGEHSFIAAGPGRPGRRHDTTTVSSRSATRLPASRAEE